LFTTEINPEIIIFDGNAEKYELEFMIPLEVADVPLWFLVPQYDRRYFK
jgi:hypothetical protein